MAKPLVDLDIVTLDDPRWAPVAEQLGLRPVRVIAGRSISEWTFPAFRREISEPQSVSMRTTTWLHGEPHGVPVIVRPNVLSPSTTYLEVVAEIDPPLFAGLRVYSRELGTFFGMHPDLPIGFPAADVSFIFQAFDARRLHQLLGPQDRLPSDELVNAMRFANNSGPIVVRDGYVEVMTSSVTPNLSKLDDRIKAASYIARTIGGRAKSLAERPEEQAARASWEGYAAHVQLSFDWRRWRIWGKLQNIDVEVMLEGSPPSVFTTFRATFPRSLGCGLYVRRGVQERKDRFGWAGATARYEEFDQLLVIHARDMDRQAQLFGDANVRALISKEARGGNFFITDLAITMTRPGFATPDAIARRLDALCSMINALCPPMRTAGPFR